MKDDSICKCGHYDFDHERNTKACAFNTRLQKCACTELRVGITVDRHDGQVTLRMPSEIWDRLIGPYDTNLARAVRGEL